MISMRLFLLVTTMLCYTLVVIAGTLYVIREDVGRQLDQAQQIAETNKDELASCRMDVNRNLYKEYSYGTK